jgi:hypothetical protein
MNYEGLSSEGHATVVLLSGDTDGGSCIASFTNSGDISENFNGGQTSGHT